jgi:hypothetical protein
MATAVQKKLHLNTNVSFCCYERQNSVIQCIYISSLEYSSEQKGVVAANQHINGTDYSTLLLLARTPHSAHLVNYVPMNM